MGHPQNSFPNTLELQEEQDLFGVRTESEDEFEDQMSANRTEEMFLGLGQYDDDDEEEKEGASTASALSVSSNSSADIAIQDDDHVHHHRDNVFLPFWSGFAGVGASRESLSYFIGRVPFLLVVMTFICIDLWFYFITRFMVLSYENIVFWFGRGKHLKARLAAASSFKDYTTASLNLDKFLGNDSWKLEDGCTFYDEKLIHRITRRLRRARLLVRKEAAEAAATALSSNNNKSSSTQRNNLPTSSSPCSPDYQACDESNAPSSSSSASSATMELLKMLKHGAFKPNIAGIDNEALYSQTFTGTKKIVEEYLDEVVKSLHFVTNSENVPLVEKLDFLKNSARVFGRTALCLSGGATIGYYHIGVVKALFENNVLPKVITGSSAGSLIAALICCRTDDELVSEVFTPDIYSVLTACDGTWMEWLKRLYTEGAIFSQEEWAVKMEVVTKGNMTFMEAYKRTGRILNIPVVPFESYASSGKMLNYITAPDVVIYTAVMASSAIPNILNPVTLLCKRDDGLIVPYLSAGHKWRDGSIKNDIPERELHHLFDVNYTIVSQTNPHILIFFYERTGSAGVPVAHRAGRGWRGGFISSSIVQHFKLDMQKWLLLLRDLSLMPKYQKTDMSDVFTQKFEGSVTITPPVTVQDFVLLFRDPNAERMANFINGGQRRTWAKLPMIINRLRLEKALRDCRRKVLAADMQFQSNKLVAVKVRSVYNNSNKNSSGGTNSVKLRKSASVGARISNSNSSSTNTSAATTSSSIFNIPQEHPTTIDESVFVKGDGISKPTTRKRNKRRSRRLSSTAPPPSPAGLCDSAYASSSFYSVLSDI